MVHQEPPVPPAKLDPQDPSVRLVPQDVTVNPVKMDSVEITVTQENKD